jgi:hypothetical protein
MKLRDSSTSLSLQQFGVLEVDLVKEKEKIMQKNSQIGGRVNTK